MDGGAGDTAGSPTHSTLAVGLGRLIREAREAAGRSQADVSLTLGRRRNWLSRIEAGRKLLSVEGLSDLAAELRIDPELLGLVLRGGGYPEVRP